MKREDVVKAMARGYAAPDNSGKTVDPTLISAMADEVMKLVPAERTPAATGEELNEAARRGFGPTGAAPAK